MNVYVYYDVPLAGCTQAAPRVRAMQATLRHHASRIALFRRPQGKPASQTWMEVYEDVPIDFEAVLARAVTQAGLESVAGPRHVERFVPID